MQKFGATPSPARGPAGVLGRLRRMAAGIDLTALLASVIGGAPSAAVENLARAAVAASDEGTFRACLAHRVLAQLLSAGDDPTRIAAVSERARLLLALAD
ncbi:hypothetical protein ABH926_002808 [Catenulispora sp. GP43]|uniref:hypothetical protein n=1 Tax=Catenulispora sp. GP43 TaxID=3156263 RepID=UPI0035173F8F